MNLHRARLCFTLAYFAICTCCRELPAADLSSDSIYDKTKILNVSIELPAEDWQQLLRQSRDPQSVFAGKLEEPFTYFQGDITIEGVAIQSVGIRKKGFMGSLDDHFPSLKIKFDEFVAQTPIADLEGLTLNNNKQDSSLVSQTLAYEAFNAAGVSAPRCTFAKVTVNGEFLGLYSNVESISQSFLKRRFKNNNGNLYEGTLADFYPHALDRMEIKTNKKKHDRSKLDRLAKMLSEEETLSIDKVDELVDIDNFLRYWAIESLIGFWDGYTNNQNNYWVYENKSNGKFYFMPWGADAAFMQSGFPGFGPSGAVSIYSESILANRLIQNEAISQRYRETMRWVLDNIWKEADMIQRIDQIETMLEGQTHRRQGGVARSMQGVREFIKRRRKLVEQELDAWPVRVAPFPRKPMYVVPVGNITGDFKTTKSDRPAGSISARANAKVTLTIDDQVVPFASIGVSIHPAPRGGFPGFGPPMPPGPPMMDIVLEGERAADGKISRIALAVPEAVLSEAEGKTIQVDGFYVPDSRAGGFGMPMGGRTTRGSITFRKLGMKSGDPIEATIDLTVSEVRGGFMNRSRVEPGSKHP